MSESMKALCTVYTECVCIYSCVWEHEPCWVFMYCMCRWNMCLGVYRGKEKRAEGRRQLGVRVCVRVNLLVWSTRMSLTQNVRSASSVSRGVPCPSGVCRDRNKSGIKRIWMAPEQNSETMKYFKSNKWGGLSYLTPYAKMMNPMRTPMVPSRNQTSAWCLKTSALIRMENPITAPTKELNPWKHNHWENITSVSVFYV